LAGFLGGLARRDRAAGAPGTARELTKHGTSHPHRSNPGSPTTPPPPGSARRPHGVRTTAAPCPTSVEDRALRARALELEEARRARDQDAPVPQPPGGLALRRGRHHGAEERRPAERDDGRPDVLADAADALGVRRAQ